MVNIKLKEHVDMLGSKVVLLDTEIKAAAEVSASLKITKDDLEQVVGQLSTQVLEQSNLLDANQREILRVTQAFDANQAVLAQKIAELEYVKTDLGLQLDEARAVVQIMQDTTLALSSTLIGSEDDRSVFQEKLNAFLNDKNKNFAELADRFSATQGKLALTEEQLRQCSEQHEARLQELNRQIDRLTSIIAEKDKKPSFGVRDLLSQAGIFAEKISREGGANYSHG